MGSCKLIIRGFVEILRNSLKIFFESGRLIPSIASLTLLLYTLFFLSNTFSIEPLISDLLIKGTLLATENPNGSDLAKLLTGMKEDIRIFTGVESAFFIVCSIVSVFCNAPIILVSAFFVACSIVSVLVLFSNTSPISSLVSASFLVCSLVSLFSNTAIILVSAKALCGKNLSLKELLSGVVRSWKRLFITSFYTTLLSSAYFVCALFALLFTVFVIADGSVASVLPILIVLGIIALIVYLYLIIDCFLDLVISVIEAPVKGKDGVLAKGHRLNGFALNVLYMILCFIIYHSGFQMIKVGQSPGAQMGIGLFLINSISLVNMFMFIAYTVLYFQCKKTHGEEIELQDSIEYSKIPTKPHAEDIP